MSCPAYGHGQIGEELDKARRASTLIGRMLLKYKPRKLSLPSVLAATFKPITEYLSPLVIFYDETL